MVETCGHLKRHQEKSKKGKKQIPTYRGSIYSLKSRLNHPGTLNKVQQELEYSKG